MKYYVEINLRTLFDFSLYCSQKHLNCSTMTVIYFPITRFLLVLLRLFLVHHFHISFIPWELTDVVNSTTPNHVPLFLSGYVFLCLKSLSRNVLLLLYILLILTSSFSFLTKLVILIRSC